MALDLAATPAREPVHHVVPATPANCWWGYIDRDEPPRLKVASGDIVEIEAVTHHAGDASTAGSTPRPSRSCRCSPGSPRRSAGAPRSP